MSRYISESTTRALLNRKGTVQVRVHEVNRQLKAAELTRNSNAIAGLINEAMLLSAELADLNETLRISAEQLRNGRHESSESTRGYISPMKAALLAATGGTCIKDALLEAQQKEKGNV